MGWVALVSLALFFIWLFYKGYKAYQKNGWDDDFFKNDGAGFGGLGQLFKYTKKKFIIINFKPNVN